jgi:hypothetical protein
MRDILLKLNSCPSNREYFINNVTVGIEKALEFPGLNLNAFERKILIDILNALYDIPRHSTGFSAEQIETAIILKNKALCIIEDGL